MHRSGQPGGRREQRAGDREQRSGREEQANGMIRCFACMYEWSFNTSLPQVGPVMEAPVISADATGLPRTWNIPCIHIRRAWPRVRSLTLLACDPRTRPARKVRPWSRSPRRASLDLNDVSAAGEERDRWFATRTEDYWLATDGVWAAGSPSIFDSSNNTFPFFTQKPAPRSAQGCPGQRSPVTPRCTASSCSTAPLPCS